MIEARLFSIGMGRTANPDSITQIARKADERIGQIQGIFAPLPVRTPPPVAASRSRQWQRPRRSGTQRGKALPGHMT